ncbi:MAG: hypothetical protein ABI678_18215, partial [Kofleriaceae bacterium]
MRKTKYTREVLAPVVANARSLSDVIRAFGLKPTGGNHRSFTSLIARAGLETSHFTRRIGIGRYPREELAALAATCGSVAQMLAALGLPLSGRPHHNLSRRLRLLDVDTSHFHGRGWSKGKTRDTSPSVALHAQKIEFPDRDVFVELSSIRGKALMPRLLRRGWRYECKHCGISEWRGGRLTLHIDHIIPSHRPQHHSRSLDHGDGE